MPEIFQYSFMIRALVAGLIVAVMMPVLGCFLVARRYALIADSFAHVSLAGIGAGLLLGWAPVMVAIPVAVMAALVLEWLRQKRQVSGEVSLAILASTGLALAIVFTGLAGGGGGTFESYLFGSIATTSELDLITICVMGAVVLGLVVINYRPLVYIAFDEDGARIAGYRVQFLNYLLVAITAMVVVLSLRIVGGLLVSAMLVMPVVAASWLVRSFWVTMWLAVGIAMVAVVSGLVVAFYVGIAAGGAIVLAALLLLLLALVWRR